MAARMRPRRRGTSLAHALRVDTVQVRDVEVIVETEGALLCVVRDREVWIPREHVLNAGIWRVGERGTLVLPRWLAELEGLV
jgi:hypothetical protein